MYLIFDRFNVSFHRRRKTSVCLAVCLCHCFSACLCFSLPVSVCSCLCLSVCLFFSVFVCLRLSTSVCVCLCLSLRCCCCRCCHSRVCHVSIPRMFPQVAAATGASAAATPADADTPPRALMRECGEERAKLGRGPCLDKAPPTQAGGVPTQAARTGEHPQLQAGSNTML